MSVAPILSGRTLLVVDDEDILRELVSESIRAVGYTVWSAANVDEATRIIESTPVHAVLSDILMPGGTGIDLLTQIRARGLDVPFVFLSSFESRANLLRAMRLGAADFIEKPCQRDELLRAVDLAVEAGVRRSSTQQILRSLSATYPKEIQQLKLNTAQIGRIQAIAARRK